MTWGLPCSNIIATTLHITYYNPYVLWIEQSCDKDSILAKLYTIANKRTANKRTDSPWGNYSQSQQTVHWYQTNKQNNKLTLFAANGLSLRYNEYSRSNQTILNHAAKETYSSGIKAGELLQEMIIYIYTCTLTCILWCTILLVNI
jgi:hypothetical protein